MSEKIFPVVIAGRSGTRLWPLKKIVAALQEARRNEGTLHRRVHRSWDWYDSIDRGQRFQGKQILVNPGATISLSSLGEDDIVCFEDTYGRR